MKIMMALFVLMSGSIAMADVLECKLVVEGKVERSYADRNEVARVQIGDVRCSGQREGQNNIVIVDDRTSARTSGGPGEQIVIINGGSSDKEVYATSFCSCSNM